jgi:excisionase family DNA binding protein
MDEPTRLLLTVEEAGKAMQAGRSTMYELIKSGQIESVKIGRIRRIPVDAVQTYVTSLRQEQARAASETAALA